MFTYKSTDSSSSRIGMMRYGMILLFNLAHVVEAKPDTYNSGHLLVILSNSSEIRLANNWEGRDDVARFKKAMSEYSGVQWDDKV